jgi:hypothetical protein
LFGQGAHGNPWRRFRMALPARAATSIAPS